MATHRAGQLGGEAPGVQFSLRHGALLLSWGSVSLPQLRTPQSQGSWDLGPPDRGGAGSGEEPGAACQPDPRGTLAPPIPGQAVGMLTPHHCPPRAELESGPLPIHSHLRSRLASALATPQTWCLLASPWGDPPTPKVARSAVCVYRSCWAGLRLCPGFASPQPQSCVQ